MSSKQEAKNRKELTSFCANVLKKLINMEKEECGRPSTMKQLVRVDVGVMKVDGKYHYFVNEITRAFEMYLFSKMVRDHGFLKIVGHAALRSIKELIEYSKEK